MKRSFEKFKAYLYQFDDSFRIRIKKEIFKNAEINNKILCVCGTMKSKERNNTLATLAKFNMENETV